MPSTLHTPPAIYRNIALSPGEPVKVEDNLPLRESDIVKPHMSNPAPMTSKIIPGCLAFISTPFNLIIINKT